MTIQLICLGDELLNGKTQDQNSHWLASFCRTHGLELVKIHITPDDEELFASSLKEALLNSDLVMTSGGLGPTQDDDTKHFLAHFFKKDIIYNDQAASEKRQNSYAEIPRDFIALPNPIGHAPGLYYACQESQYQGKHVLALPGVPSEFTEMVKLYLKGILKNSWDKHHHEHFVIRTWKIPEREIFHTLMPSLWEELEPFGKVSSLPNSIGVDIGVHLNATTKEELNHAKLTIRNRLQASPLADYIWRFGETSLAQTILENARKAQVKIGTAESCTGGLCSSLITDVPGSAEIFWGSVVSYSNDIKIKTLEVNELTLDEFGAVSTQTAQEMAQGLKKKFQLDFALATSGIAGPDTDNTGKPAGLIAYAVAGPQYCLTLLHQFSPRPREEMKSAFANMGLALLNQEICKQLKL